MSRTPARFGSCIGPSVQTPMKQAQAGWFDPPLLKKSGDNGKEQHPGADFTSAWRAILDGLRESNPVDGFSVERWQALIADSERFLAPWGARALQLGWTELDLFGVHPEGPASRFDVIGLIPIINGGEVVAITERNAIIKTLGGSRLVYMRRTSGGSVCFWELAEK